MAVKVTGTGLVDVLTLSGRSTLEWTENYEMEFYGGVELTGNLEAVLEKQTVKGKSVKIPLHQYSRPIIMSGERKNKVTISQESDYYLASIGQIKNYFRRIRIISEG